MEEKERNLVVTNSEFDPTDLKFDPNGCTYSDLMHYAWRFEKEGEGNYSIFEAYHLLKFWKNNCTAKLEGYGLPNCCSKDFRKAIEIEEKIKKTDEDVFDEGNSILPRDLLSMPLEDFYKIPLGICPLSTLAVIAGLLLMQYSDMPPLYLSSTSLLHEDVHKMLITSLNAMLELKERLKIPGIPLCFIDKFFFGELRTFCAMKAGHKPFKKRSSYSNKLPVSILVENLVKARHAKENNFYVEYLRHLLDERLEALPKTSIDKIIQRDEKVIENGALKTSFDELLSNPLGNNNGSFDPSRMTLSELVLYAIWPVIKSNGANLHLPPSTPPKISEEMILYNRSLLAWEELKKIIPDENEKQQLVQLETAILAQMLVGVE